MEARKMNKKSFIISFLFLCFVLFLCYKKNVYSFVNQNSLSQSVKILEKYPHDEAAFTQGLIINNNIMFESTGLYSQSALRQVDYKTGKVIKSIDLDDNYFAEGLTLVNDKLYQITWRSGVGFIYNSKTLEKIGQFRYKGEGWGLTWDGQYLIMSNGSDVLKYINPENFNIIRLLKVTKNKEPVYKINELEYINGEIWANIWKKDIIIKINPKNGQVITSIDASNLKDELYENPINENVLNGIAWDKKTDKLYMTGKNWPALFQVSVE